MANDVKVLKLITGEEVLARISDDLSNGDGLIILNKPMTLQAVPGQGGQVGFALIPLFMSGKNENITISIDHVIAQDEPNTKSEKNYLAAVTGLSL